jgi:hypothetical protein
MKSSPTPALSSREPRERESLLPPADSSLVVAVSRSGKERFPLLGERVRVRASHLFNE